MTTLTSGPATATTSSCQGLSGMRCSRATPPMGSSVMLGARMPNPRAARMWPNSCRTTQPKSARMKSMPWIAAGRPTDGRGETNPRQEQQESNVNPDFSSSDASDFNGPAHKEFWV